MDLPRFRRPNYFVGKIISAGDFQAEQDYHRTKARLHNRLLLGAGIVSGLKVAVSGGHVVVSPGLAIDCHGNELLLTEENRQPLPEGGKRFFVAVRYLEVPVDFAPSSDDEPQASFIEESLVVEVLEAPPPSHDTRLSTRLVGCDPPHALCLALLRRQRNGWRIRPQARRIRIRV